MEACGIENEAAEEAREQIRLLLDYDGQNVHELSTGQDMSVQTIRLLYEFLTGTLEIWRYRRICLLKFSRCLNG